MQSGRVVSIAAAAAAATGLAYLLYKKYCPAPRNRAAAQAAAAAASLAPSAVPSSSSSATAAIESFPVFDLAAFLSASTDKEKAALIDQCRAIADNLHKYGLLIVKDPRVKEEENEVFIDMMEKYFEQPRELTAPDAHPEVFYQVGVTPDGVERARDHCSKVKDLPADARPDTICPPGVDPKWRFFWRMGDAPKATKFPSLNAPPVIPKAFPEWPTIMNSWGSKILATVHTVAEMAALGFNLPGTTFTDLLKFGPHLLAPTGSDLAQFGKLKTVFASFHYDLNFMTIHGRSRFPGLFVWTRDGKKVLVRVPPNCLLLQAGKQFEWLTGGTVLAGFHEVVVCPETIQAIERRKKEGKSLWRISSTLFSHVASDNLLFPLPQFASKEAVEKYPQILAGDQVQQELKAIKLGKDEAPPAM